MITGEGLYTALTGALVEASSEGVEVFAVPAFGVMAEFLATMDAAVRSFGDLTELIGIHMPTFASSRTPASPAVAPVGRAPCDPLVATSFAMSHTQKRCNYGVRRGGSTSRPTDPLGVRRHMVTLRAALAGSAVNGFPQEAE